MLLIDFDYQGSLTDAVIKTDEELNFGAVDLINGKLSIEEVLKRIPTSRWLIFTGPMFLLRTTFSIELRTEHCSTGWCEKRRLIFVTTSIDI